MSSRPSARSWIVAAALCAVPWRASAEDVPPRLRRVPDVVTVTGEALAPLGGARLDHLGLFAVGAGGELAPIPFQLDEKTADGAAYVFPSGPEANPGAGNGQLDPHDELLFVAADAGPRIAAGAAWPAGAEAAVELSAHDPVDHGAAFAYLFRFAGVAPRSAVGYVHYDRARDQIVARSYTIRYTPGKDRVYFSGVSVPPAAGGTGGDFVDRLKLRTYVKTLLYFSLSFDEDEWEDEVTAYLEGPIRVIRQERNRLTFMGIEVAPTVTVDAMYFPDFHLAPVRVDQTIHFPSVALEAWFKLSMDLSEEGKGMRYYRPSPGAATPWHTIDGTTTDDERNLDPAHPAWHLVTGEPGTFLWWVEMPPPLVPVTRLTYTDDAATADPPERVPGSIGEVAYKFDLFPLDVGVYHMRLFYLFPPHWKPGDERAWVDMISRPLTVEAHPLAR